MATGHDIAGVVARPRGLARGARRRRRRERARLPRVIAGLGAAAVLLAASGCTQEQLVDVETSWTARGADGELAVTYSNPDSIHVVRNIDLHPNLAILCYQGVAVMTHTREAAPVRVPEWDRTCPSSELSGS